MDSSPPGSSVHGILQARILEWVPMPSSRGSSWPRDRTCFSYVSCVGRWILYHQCYLGSPRSSFAVMEKIHIFLERTELLVNVRDCARLFCPLYHCKILCGRYYFQDGKSGSHKVSPYFPNSENQVMLEETFRGLRPHWGKAAPEQPLPPLWPSSHRSPGSRHDGCISVPPMLLPSSSSGHRCACGMRTRNGVSRWQDRLVPTNQPVRMFFTSRPWVRRGQGEKRGVCIQHLDLLSSVSFYVSLDL